MAIASVPHHPADPNLGRQGGKKGMEKKKQSNQYMKIQLLHRTSKTIFWQVINIYENVLQG